MSQIDKANVIIKKHFKERFTIHTKNLKEPEEDFVEILSQDSSAIIDERCVVQGKVVEANKSHIIVDVNAKNEYAIPIAEFQLDPSETIPKEGDQVNVYVEQVQNRAGKTVLSREKAIREEAWGPLEKAFENNDLVKGVIFGQIKGGLTVDLSGIVAFLPGSQIDTKPVKDVTPFMNIVQDFQIIKMDKKLGNIIVSRRKVLDMERADARSDLYKKLSLGTKLSGVVKNITDYGAFIDLNSTDGLVHITDISWKRINHPSEVLTIGQEVEVIVIDITELENGNKRIALGMKQTDNTPWNNIKLEFPIDKVFNSKITNITDYGVFVSLKDGIDGLVHSSQLRWSKIMPKDIKNHYKIGDEVKCKVIGVDDEKYRISLSIKQCIDRPWDKFLQANPVGTIITKDIKSIASFGIFVDLDTDVVGLLHESDMHQKDKAMYKKHFSQEAKKEITCRVIFIDEEKNRIGLSTKDLYEEDESKQSSSEKEDTVKEK